MLVFDDHFSDAERSFRDRVIDGFVPGRVWDFHAHLLASRHFRQELPSYLDAGETVGVDRYKEALEELLPGREKRALLFGMPARNSSWEEANQWVASETEGHPEVKALALCPPEVKSAEAASWLGKQRFLGIKPYHLFAARSDSQNAAIEEYAPEWMWEYLNGQNGILMLHIVRDEAIVDEGNIASLRRLSARYPGCQVILAHIARSFCQHHAREGLARVADCGNIWLDTSAITERETFVSALKIFRPERILFGTDYPVSHFRGHCQTEGRGFRWVLQEKEHADQKPPSSGFRPVGLESLHALRQAAETMGLDGRDVDAIFFGNADRLLAKNKATFA